MVKAMVVQVDVNPSKCDACGICADICPRGVFTFYPTDNREIGKMPAGFRAYPSHEGRCIGCGICTEKCPKKAISIKILRKDDESADFVEDLISKEMAAL